MIRKIFDKYEGSTDNWYPLVTEHSVYRSPDVAKYRKESEGMEATLLAKYKEYIPTGWYGFSFGSPTPKGWFLIVDEFLQYLIGLQADKKISAFEIHQIKMKYGGLRFYVSYQCQDDELRKYIEEQIDLLESHLSDEKLIY